MNVKVYLQTMQAEDGTVIQSVTIHVPEGNEKEAQALAVAIGKAIGQIPGIVIESATEVEGHKNRHATLHTLGVHDVKHSH